MRKMIATALLALPLLAPFARAADPALVAKIEPYLRDDEKAFLASILTRPAMSAEFDAEAPVALKDSKALKPFLDSWRAKIEAFAEVDSKQGYPDLEAHYGNYAQLMTPEQRAYMVRRLPTMKEDDRNSLIGYLNTVNDALAKNGQLTWYTKKVVAGIMDHYRQDLTTYIATPIAQSAKRDGPAAAVQLAALLKADDAAQLAARTPPAPVEVAAADQRPAPKPKPATKPEPKPEPKPAPVAAGPAVVPSAPVVVTGPKGGALQQAQNAANGGSTADQIFDGGTHGAAPVGGSAVVVPPSGGAATPRPSGLTPSTPVTPALTAGVPSPAAPPADANFMASISKMQTKPADTPLINHLPTVVGGLLGGLLGGLIGFLLGGPVGLIIGAAAGVAAGGVTGHIIANHLFQ